MARPYPGEVVRFTTADGVALSGTLFREGPVGVVLAHMFSTDQKTWHLFARQLAGEGYRAMAFDFRGYGRSGGTRRIDQIDRDVRAAEAFLREQGGPPTGAHRRERGRHRGHQGRRRGRGDALVVLEQPDELPRADSDPRRTRPPDDPSLWITSKDDAVTPNMRAMHAAAGGAKTLHVYSGSVHGTFIFDSLHGIDLPGRIIVFVARHVPPQ